jgi:hypothetical protein
MKLISQEADDEQNQTQVRWVQLDSFGTSYNNVTRVGRCIGQGAQSQVSDSGPHVVAHISFAELSAVDMSMQKKGNDKYYVYVQHSRDQEISIIDISKPANRKPLE